MKIKLCGCLFVLTIALLSYSKIGQAEEKTCLFVSSYHEGYEWSDGIEKGFESSIGDACTVSKFYLDTKRNKSPEFAEFMALKAKELIDTTNPDVVIVCDDNASKYLVVPYYKDAVTPFVFCGVNNNADGYGYPYSNVTGMIEIAPVKYTRDMIKEIIPEVDKGVYLSMDITSQYKEYALNKRIYEESGIGLERILINNMEEWVEGFIQAQEYPFVIVGSSGGIKNWDIEKAKKIAMDETRTFTVTNMHWLDVLSVLTITKVAEEQGEWSAEVAKAILQGAKPIDIPIIANKKWDIKVNMELSEKIDIEIPQTLYDKAIKSNSK